MLQNVFDFATPYMDIYRVAEAELTKNKYDTLLVTGNPFTFFKFGHLLSKKFNISWFADYRDDWTTSPSFNLWYNNVTVLKHFARWLEESSEKKWLSNATSFFSISENYVQKIANFIGKKGHVIYNGFIAEDFEPYLQTPTNNEFTVCFNGTLIDIQPIEIFLEAYKKLILEFKPKMKLKLLFVGTSFHENQSLRLKKIMLGFEENVEITKRINHAKAIEMQAKSHVLLLVAFTGITGAPGSKIFDYLALQKPIVLCPSDNGIKEKITTSTNQAIICNTADDVYYKLGDMIDKFITDKSSINKDLNTAAIDFYSRKNQAKLMIDIIKEYATK
jgi:glycosyltransferase involved in cell wall biosynthesis